MSAHPDLPAEQAHLDRSVEALLAMAARTTAALDTTEAAATANDSEVAKFHLARRLESLALRDDAPAFGRIDQADETWYVGRRHIEDGEGEPLVVDWRAPVSIPFYRATLHDPLDLDRRRRFIAEGRTLVDLLEEDFNDPDHASVSGGVPDPLLAELERERTGQIRDIVATIASEQDEIIRAPLDRLLVVQGGPGTGKTAVALHRAAYLLFEHRLELLDKGVLVVGPNPVFLRYVADVLPSLGETAVRQVTIDGLRDPSHRPRPADETAHVAALKGDVRMAAVLTQAVRSSIRVPVDDVSFSTQWGTVRLRADDVASAVDDVTSRGVPHATGKEALRNQLLHRAYETHEQVAEVPALKSNFVAGARADRGFKAYLDRVWPMPSAAVLVQRLLGSAAARRRATADILDTTEAASLERVVAKSIRDERWSPSEIPLLDEAEYLLNGARVTYGHIVADEAQDLSSMALRMLRRRADGGSVTLVGDLAQATQPWAQRDWRTVVDVLTDGSDMPVQMAELTVGYRTPAPILDLANRLLPIAAPDVTPAVSIRASGSAPVFVRAPTDVVGPTVDAASEAAAASGTVAVIALAIRHPALAEALDGAGLEWAAGARGLGTLALVDPLTAKGLEFDHVVVVEPAEIVDAEPQGYRALFVALTRATRSLVVVHARPLPPELVD